MNHACRSCTWSGQKWQLGELVSFLLNLCSLVRSLPWTSNQVKILSLRHRQRPNLFPDPKTEPQISIHKLIHSCNLKGTKIPWRTLHACVNKNHYTIRFWRINKFDMVIYTTNGDAITTKRARLNIPAWDTTLYCLYNNGDLISHHNLFVGYLSLAVWSDFCCLCV